jgi:hypothetical protein
VTGPRDVAYINGINAGSNNNGSQIQGHPGPARQIPVSSLDKFLQTTDGPDGARATLDKLRQVARSLKTPGCTGRPPPATATSPRASRSRTSGFT